MIIYAEEEVGANRTRRRTRRRRSTAEEATERSGGGSRGWRRGGRRNRIGRRRGSRGTGRRTARARADSRACSSRRRRGNAETSRTASRRKSRPPAEQPAEVMADSWPKSGYDDSTLGCGRVCRPAANQHMLVIVQRSVSRSVPIVQLKSGLELGTWINRFPQPALRVPPTQSRQASPLKRGPVSGP